MAGETALGVRLLAPLSLALGSILLARAAEDLFPGRHAGPWAAALLNATLLAGLGGVTMTPDTPLLFFWTAALWAAGAAAPHAATGAGGSRSAPSPGLALRQQIHRRAVRRGDAAVAGCWTPAMRRWLARWQLWAGGALALLAFAPVLAWNAAHGWASFAKQGGRAGRAMPGATLRFLGELVGGQAGLATPLVFVLCVAGAGAAALAWWRGRDAAALLVAALVLPGAALFLWQATGSRVQGNWPAVLYPAAGHRRGGAAARAGLAAAAHPGAGAGRGDDRRRVPARRWRRPLPLPRRSDPTLARLGGWAGLHRGGRRGRGARGRGLRRGGGIRPGLGARLPPAARARVVAMDPRWALSSRCPRRRRA